MIKAVLFDMDGVLVDTEWFYNRRRVAFMEEKGFHFDEIPDLSGVLTSPPFGSRWYPTMLSCASACAWSTSRSTARTIPFRMPSCSTSRRSR